MINEKKERTFWNSFVVGKVLLYTSIFYVAISIYFLNSFSVWKYFAVIIPLFLGIALYKMRKWYFFLLSLIPRLWFAVMLTAVGTVFNTDILELTGPIVTPEGYTAVVSTSTSYSQGSTSSSSHLICVRGDETIKPKYDPHFTLFLMYFISALILYLITIFLLKLLYKIINNKFIKYLLITIVYNLLIYILWVNLPAIMKMIP